MSLWKFGDFETEVDFLDADFLDRITEAQEQLNVDYKGIPKTGKTSDIIRAQCRCFDDFFDCVFGAGTSSKMFHTTSLLQRIEASESLSTHEKTCAGQIEKYTDKYQVKKQQNREQRRSYQKNSQRNNQKNGR